MTSLRVVQPAPKREPRKRPAQTKNGKGQYIVPHKPRYDTRKLHHQLSQYDRTPFLDLLSEWLQQSPSAEALAEFAERYPDKYVTAMASLARISGYTEKTVSLNLDVTMDLTQLSDSQLEDRLRELQARAAPARVGKRPSRQSATEAEIIPSSDERT